MRRLGKRADLPADIREVLQEKVLNAGEKALVQLRATDRVARSIEEGGQKEKETKLRKAGKKGTYGRLARSGGEAAIAKIEAAEAEKKENIRLANERKKIKAFTTAYNKWWIEQKKLFNILNIEEDIFTAERAPASPWKPKVGRKLPAKKHALAPTVSPTVREQMLHRTLQGFDLVPSPVLSPLDEDILEEFSQLDITNTLSKRPIFGVIDLQSPSKSAPRKSPTKPHIELALERTKKTSTRAKKTVQRKKAVKLKPIIQLEFSPVKTRSGRQAGQVRFV